MADATYDNITPAYNSDLLRSDQTVEMNDVTDVEQSEGERTLKAGSTLNDVWIDTWIKSSNYSPKKKGFLIDGINGYIEAVDAFFSGTIIALAGKFGTGDNYWEINSTGITAISNGGDVIINYGKIDFGQDSVNGFILGYDASAGVPKFEIGSNAGALFKYNGSNVSLTGGTITGGTFQTSTSGVRIVISGNDEIIYNDVVVGGDSGTIKFSRTDSNPGTFVFSKRVSALGTNFNVMEVFYDSLPSIGARNYLFLGRKGTANTPDQHCCNVTTLDAKDLIQIQSSKVNDHPSWVGGSSQSEIQIIADSAQGISGVSHSPTAAGTSWVQIGAISDDAQTPFDPVHLTGGAALILGTLISGGIIPRIYIDCTGSWLGDDLSPYTTNATNLGKPSFYFGNVYTSNVTLGTPSGAYINWNNNHIRFNAQTQTIGSIFSSGDLYAGSSNGTSGGTGGSVITGSSTGLVVNRGKNFYAQQIQYVDWGGINRSKWVLAA